MMLAPEMRPTTDKALQHPWMDIVINLTENAGAKHLEIM